MTLKREIMRRKSAGFSDSAVHIPAPRRWEAEGLDRIPEKRRRPKP